jgi:uncharacterized protein
MILVMANKLILASNEHLKACLKCALTFVLLFFVFQSTFAQSDGIPEKPNPPRLINNLSKEFPGFFSAEETAQLETKLEEFSNTSSNQIVVVVVDDLNDMEPSTFATELGHKWGVGQGKEDNGIVILIKPTKSGIGRETFIAVGYGLEGAIPDLTANRIVEVEINPSLKAGRNFEAVEKGITVLIALAKGEYNYKTYDKSSKKVPGGLIFKLFVIILVLILLSRKNRGGGMSIGRGGVFMAPMFGGFGGGSSGGGDSGGFGGFGGGGFGGGGSGGSW